MSFAFELTDTSVADGLRRIAIEQIDKALLEASGPQADFDETVHQVRRRCKNLRGLLRIVRPGMAAFADEDQAIRTAAARLSQVRDGAVVIETFDGLMEKAPEALAEEERQAFRALLTERRRTVMLHIDQGAMLAEFCQALLAMRERAESWTLQRKRFGAIGHGIEDTYRRVRQRMRDAEAAPSPTALHAWRKQAKYHRHHVILLRRHAPDVLASRSKLLVDLGDLLGGHHDLAVLIEVLGGRIAGASAGLTRLASLAGERQAHLAEQAFALGAQIAAEKPAELTERLKRYWTLEEA